MYWCGQGNQKLIVLLHVFFLSFFINYINANVINLFVIVLFFFLLLGILTN